MGATHAANFFLHPFISPVPAFKLRRNCRKQPPQRALPVIVLSTQRPPRPPPQQRSRRRFTDIAKKAPLISMPRCSSFYSMNTLQLGSSNITINDPNYAQWKSSFEQLRRSSTPRMERARIYNISESLSGQLSPKGVPTNVDGIKQGVSPNATTTIPGKAIGGKSTGSGKKVRRRVSLRLPSINSSKDNPKLTKNADTKQHAAHKSQSKPPSTKANVVGSKPGSKPLFIAKLPQPQAKVVERLYEEIRDWQDYYGTRLDYYYL